MAERCEECGKEIGPRARANIWKNEHVVCTNCLHALETATVLQQTAIADCGWPQSPWYIEDAAGNVGPYSTDQVIELLRNGQACWDAQIWREGMKAKKKIARLFTIPALSKDGQIRFRDIWGDVKRPRLL